MATYSGNQLVLGVRLLKYIEIVNVTYMKQIIAMRNSKKDCNGKKEFDFVKVYDKEGNPYLEESKFQYVKFNDLNFFPESDETFGQKEHNVKFEKLTFEKFLKKNNIDWVSATHYHTSVNGQVGDLDVIGKIVVLEMGGRQEKDIDIDQLIKLREEVSENLNKINIIEKPKLYLVGRGCH